MIPQAKRRPSVALPVARSRSPSRSDLIRAGRVAPALTRWYERHGRSFVWRGWRDPYRLAVTEVLLQRTRAEVVAAFVERFFVRFPDWTALGQADARELETELRPLGLQRRRAESLHRLAVSAAEDSGLAIDLHHAGIGQYIDRALRVGMTGASVAMVDSNFVRIVRRAFGGRWLADYRYDTRLQGIAHRIIERADNPRHANWAILDIGATVCLPRRPRCGACPLASQCLAVRTGQVT